MLTRFIIFLVLNFGGLALGSLFTKTGVSSEWYAALSKAPWTPPGWSFGVAWSIIMLCFSYYMAKLLEVRNSNKVLKNTIVALYSFQWLLNVSWNTVFFYYHNVFLGLVVLFLLATTVGYIYYLNIAVMKKISFYMAPYLFWLVVAISLNGYIFIYNQ